MNVKKYLPELVQLEAAIEKLGDQARVETLAHVQAGELNLPIYGISIGSTDPKAPCLGLFGGVHGLERIGTEVVIAFLDLVSELIQWDETFKDRLQKLRLVFVPLINPAGMYKRKRANPNGVDLMRNSPVLADDPAFLVGGQAYSPKFPWFRGNVTSEAQMETESRAVVEFVRKQMFQSKLGLALDVHSGFGVVDRLWFPYAKTKNAPPHIAEIVALKKLFDQTYPNHFYKIEPQAMSYTTHGDLWDYLYDLHQANLSEDSLFVPWCLELGSWLWLKKNPTNVFSAIGPFNPIQPHRLKRILRRHLTLFDFLQRALISSKQWAQLTPQQKDFLKKQIPQDWYADI